jgi:tripartite-type tricarboxylate transporter receptor subunit TctC
VNAGVPARNVQELIALSKRERLAFGSSGNGASSHLAGALFNSMAGTSIEHIPYRGTGPALNDLVAGHVAMVFTDVLTALPHLQGGRVRALGITTAERSAVLPDLPTIAEQGLAGYDASVFFGLVLAAGTPDPLRERLRTVFATTIAQPEMQRFLESQGMQVAPELTPAALTALMASETERWARVIREAKVKAD